MSTSGNHLSSDIWTKDAYREHIHVLLLQKMRLDVHLRSYTLENNIIHAVCYREK